MANHFYREVDALLVVLKAGLRYKMYDSSLFRAKKYIQEAYS